MTEEQRTQIKQYLSAQGIDLTDEQLDAILSSSSAIDVEKLANAETDLSRADETYDQAMRPNQGTWAGRVYVGRGLAGSLADVLRARTARKDAETARTDRQAVLEGMATSSRNARLLDLMQQGATAPVQPVVPQGPPMGGGLANMAPVDALRQYRMR